jgi:hypothetical protein
MQGVPSSDVLMEFWLFVYHTCLNNTLVPSSISKVEEKKGEGCY